MNPYVQFGIGLSLLSAMMLYIAWTKIRVVFLRQEIFGLRDSLWDEARRRGCLDDAGYRAARQHLNNIIKIAPMMSIPTMITISAETDLPPTTDRFTCRNASFQASIDEACQRATLILARYVLWDRASGPLMLLTLGTRRVIHGLSSKLIRSTLPDSMSQLISARYQN